MSNYVENKITVDIIRVKIDDYERDLEFKQGTDIEAIRNYIVGAAQNYNLPVNRSDIYWKTCKMTSYEPETDRVLRGFLTYLVQRRQKREEKNAGNLKR